MSAGVEGQCKCGGFAMEGSSDCRDCACAAKDDQQVEEHYEQTECDCGFCYECHKRVVISREDYEIERAVDRMHGLEDW